VRCVALAGSDLRPSSNIVATFSLFTGAPASYVLDCAPWGGMR